MNGSQPWYTSQTQWSDIITMVIPIATVLFHVSVGPGMADTIAVTAAGLGTIIAGLIGWFGRRRATTTIAGTPAAALAAVTLHANVKASAISAGTSVAQAAAIATDTVKKTT